jgi:hypothetical protein
MSSTFAHLARCLDLRDQDVADAVVTRGAAKSLLAHLATISAPNTGVAKVLLLFARMATTACDWLDGDLYIELVGDDELTVIEALTELGGGLRERVFAPTSFGVPLVEFARAIERVPHLIAPLAIRANGARRISLSASAAVRLTSMPPPPIEIAPESLFVRIQAAALPSNMGDGHSLPVVRSDVASELAAPAKEPPPPASTPQQVRAPSEQPSKDVDEGWDD